MATASIIVIVLNTLAVAAMIYIGMGLGDRLERWVMAAISEEIRKQDDRIEKRVTRAQGQSIDNAGTKEDNGTYAIGQPVRRRK